MPNYLFILVTLIYNGEYFYGAKVTNNTNHSTQTKSTNLNKNNSNSQTNKRGELKKDPNFKIK